MNTITIYTTTEDLISKITLIELLSQQNSTKLIETLKLNYKRFDVFLTNRDNKRVAFNINFSTFSLLSIFIGGNLLTD